LSPAEQSLRHLGLRHLEREHRDGDFVAECEVRRDAETERRLAHARAGGDDDQVAGLESRRQPVQVTEPRGHSGDVGAGLVQSGDAFEALLEQVLDVAELGRDPALRQFEHDLLGPVDEDLRLSGTLPAELRDLLPRGDQPSERRHLADDPRVVRGVCGRRNERRQLVQANATADSFQLASLLQLVDQGDRIDGLALGVERERRAVDLGVALAVEVRGVEDLAHRPDRARGEQHGPEDRFLGLEVLGGRDRGGFRELGDRCHVAE
jgi:hypothetical protein